MSKSPAFQFYAAEYLADENVAIMTLEEEGAYIRAIAYCWREGSIPADDERLGRLLKGATNQTLRVVRECFNQMPTDATRLVHPRLEKEREKQALWAKKSAKGGKASGKSRREKALDAEPNAKGGSQMVEPNANTSSSSSSSSSNKKQPPSALVLPEWISREAWAGFLEMRRGKRAPNTDHALKGIIRELVKLRTAGNDPNAVLDQSTMRGWTGVFELKSLREAPKSDPLAGMTFANRRTQ